MKRLILWTGILVFALTTSTFAATAVKITVVAFGGKVTITDASGKLVPPAKGAVVSMGSTISTGPNSWIDLAQGGLSTIRVKAKTKSFFIKQSTFDKQTNQSISFFKLLKGAVFVRTNKANLTKGSKYQIQMPELIAGVVGSEGECNDGPGGSTVHNVSGSWNAATSTGTQSIPAGSSAVDPVGTAGPTVTPTPPAVTATLTVTAQTVPVPSGGATDGGCTGGTAAGETPSGAAVAGATDGGTLDAAAPSGGGDAATADTTTTDVAQPQGEQSSTTASPSTP